MPKHRERWYSRKVVRKALPALMFLGLVLLSLLFLARYTQAIYLVVLAWILLPVLAVKLWRWLRSRLGPGG